MAASPLKLSLESLSSFGIFVISEPLGTLNAQQQQPPMNPMAAASAALPADERCNHFAFCGSKEPSASDAFVSSHNDATIRVTNAATGKISGLFHVKDAGCRLVTATHHPSAVIHAASKGGPQSGRIVLHSLHDDKIIRLFEGHSDFVSSISMNPADDTFLTCSRDGTFKMWDLRQRAPIAAGDLHSKGAAACAFDSGGVVFACVTGNRMLSLYDAKTFTSFASTKEPLLQQTVMPGRYPPGPQGTAIPGLAPPPPETLNAGLSAAKAMASVGAPPMPPYIAWTGIEFSPNDRFLAMSTADRGVLIVDAFFPARELALLNSHPTDHLQPCNVSWSPDGSFLATGSVDGHVYCYDLSGKPTDESVIGVDDTSGLTRELLLFNDDDDDGDDDDFPSRDAPASSSLLCLSFPDFSLSLVSPACSPRLALPPEALVAALHHPRRGPQAARGKAKGAKRRI